MNGLRFGHTIQLEAFPADGMDLKGEGLELAIQSGLGSLDGSNCLKRRRVIITWSADLTMAWHTLTSVCGQQPL